jgi:hypothetical protein
VLKRATTPKGINEMASDVKRELPDDAAGLRLCKIFPGDDLRLCETVLFTKGRAAVDTVLRRAAISGGRVEIEPKGPLPDHFADIMDRHGDMVGNVALDAASFKALKDHWMRCKYERCE